jgi:hypothetical protein
VIPILLSSCSTIFNGSRQNITIKAQPDNSEIYVNGGKIGTGTATPNLKRNKNHTITVKSDGYKSETLILEKHTQAGFIILDVLGCFVYGIGFIPLIVDGATGSWHKFEQDFVNVELVKEK